MLLARADSWRSVEVGVNTTLRRVGNERSTNIISGISESYRKMCGIGATTLFSLTFFTSVLSYRMRSMGRIVQARPTVLVQRSALIEEHLNRERIAPEDIFSAMHKVGLERLEQVEWAILESDGRISLIPSAPLARTT